MDRLDLGACRLDGTPGLSSPNAWKSLDLCFGPHTRGGGAPPSADTHRRRRGAPGSRHSAPAVVDESPPAAPRHRQLLAVHVTGRPMMPGSTVKLVVKYRCVSTRRCRSPGPATVRAAARAGDFPETIRTPRRCEARRTRRRPPPSRPTSRSGDSARTTCLACQAANSIDDIISFRPASSRSSVSHTTRSGSGRPAAGAARH